MHCQGPAWPGGELAAATIRPFSTEGGEREKERERPQEREIQEGKEGWKCGKKVEECAITNNRKYTNVRRLGWVGGEPVLLAVCM